MMVNGYFNYIDLFMCSTSDFVWSINLCRNINMYFSEFILSGIHQVNLRGPSVVSLLMSNKQVNSGCNYEEWLLNF